MNLDNDLHYLGIPYKTHGVPPEAADCWTLCRYFAKRELALEWPQYMYTMETQTEDSVALINEHANGPDWITITERPCDLDKIQRGDILIMTVAGSQQHCGIAIQPTEFLHSISGRNSTIERVGRWATHIDAVIRWSA
jgi:cell wall-associated NlpC family hydrolase